MDDRRFDDMARMLGRPLTRHRFLALVASAFPASLVGGDAVGARKNARRRRRRRHHDGGVVIQGNGDVCGGPCFDGATCIDQAGCFCDESTGQCVTATCGGSCTIPADCGTAPGCICLPMGGGGGREFPRFIAEGDPVANGQCVTMCIGKCLKDADCPDLSNCVCTIPPGAEFGSCGPPQVCPGFCSDNAGCQEQGRDACVCFFGVDTSRAELVAQAIAEGAGGTCGSCRGKGASCDASTECCGQLVCRDGACARKSKPKPKDRCARHGHACTQDSGCCAQAICYRGRCGEKDTHCDSDRECARGYACVGGQLTGSHRRCRRKGRKTPRNRRNRGG